MGDNRENYCHAKCKFLDNKGVALITTIIVIAAILIISGAMLYLITRGIRSSGEFQRFESVQAAAEGGIEIGTYILENFEDVFYRLKQKEPNFYNNPNISLQLSGNYADNITFNRIDNCTIPGDENYSGSGVYIDRYLIGLNPENMDINDYEACQSAVWSKPFITIRPENPENAPYSEINIYVRKEVQGPTAGAGGSASLTAPSSASGGLGSAGYLLSIRSFTTHKTSLDNSSVEMLYYLLK
jgi:hypothetical protein